MEKGFTVQGHENHWGVNHLGVFLLTNLLLDSVNASEKGRIINVGSGAHEAPVVKPQGKIKFDDLLWENTKFESFPVYAHSKLCNHYFTK